MKISSRSLLSPARAGSGATCDPPPISLSNSHSRSRLRNSRSIKGGASPAMFPTTGKKKGSGFENPEPSSPKVTCIGQVRVKSKKKKKNHPKNMRSLSRRRSSGDVSFRRLEHSGNNGFGSQSQNLGSNYQECVPMQRNNQRWVHLPLTICESLRAFGSEVSCLFPCRSSCSSTVALQGGDGGGGGGREVEVVAGDDDDDYEIDEMGIGNLRRHVFQDLEIVNDSVLGSEDEGRVSTCVPPKNALLLMRCRSDPTKMEALTNRYWEPNMKKNEEEDEESFNIEERKIPEIHQEHDDLQKNAIDQEKVEVEMEMEEKVQEEKVETNQEMERKQSVEEEEEEEEHDDLQKNAIDQENVEVEMEMEEKVQEEKVETNQEMERKQSVEEEEEEEDKQEQSSESNEEEESMFLWSLFEENADHNQESEEEVHSEMEDAEEELFEEAESNIEKVKDFEEEKEEMNNSSKSLPACLLLMMMFEPKLSMEVSKETWVCSKDFIRLNSGRKPPPVPPPVKSTDGQCESKCQPARSSCSYPAPITSMMTKFDQKLVHTNGFEPLVLKRCKSEPMRDKLAPETCFWENKLDPPRRASFGLRF